jgi:hypothetical protein
MTKRNFDKELYYHTYIDMENGNDIETISYSSLICIITELCDRIEELERKLEKQEEYAVVSIGEWTVEPFSNYEINDLLALVRKAKNDNLDDNYVYQYYNSLENKISRIGLVLHSLGNT